MASISTSPNGYRRIMFYDKNKDRRTIHLGKCSQTNAERLKRRVESLLNSILLGNPIDQDDAVWLSKIGDDIREKFVAVGLCDAPPKILVPTLAEHLDSYVERAGATKKPGTLAVWRQVVSNLNELMPKGIRLDEITVGDAKDFHEALKARGMKTTTIFKRIQFCRQFLNDAVDREIISKNPFSKVKAVGSSPKSNRFVSREVIQRVLDVCNPTWKTIIALSRYGGLRCPSEVLSIRWTDIDWEMNRMSIPEPKVEHHEGRGVRSCPIFAELRPFLEEAWDLAAEGAEYVVDMPAYRQAANTGTGWKNANLRTQFLKKLRAAGVPEWNRLFHSMRASRQTELEKEFPIHVVCSWLGNSPQIAQKSYLLVTEDDFQKAVSEPMDGPSRRGTQPTLLGEKLNVSRYKTDAAGNRTEQQENEEIPSDSLVFSGNASESASPASGGHGIRTHNRFPGA
jgi:integrase